MNMNVSPRLISMIRMPTDDITHRSPALLRADGLCKSFGGNVVLDRIDLALCKGEVVLLRGENGSGKTTLLNILSGNLEPDAGIVRYSANDTHRSYRFPRKWWEKLNPLDHFAAEFVSREGIGRTWQDVRLFSSLSLRDNIVVAYPTHLGENPFNAISRIGQVRRREASLRANADAGLARLDLAGRELSSADKISLGQSKRVAIARAVAAGARILFLDEPLAGLDRQGIGSVLGLLKELVQTRGITLVIVEHVFNHIHLHDLVTADWLLDGGKIIANRVGSVADRATMARRSDSTLSTKPDWFSLLAASGADICEESLPMGAVLTRIRRPQSTPEPAKPILEIRDLIVRRGRRDVIGKSEDGKDHGFSLTLYENEIAILQAPNGWGKTTLLMSLAGLIPCRQGSIKLDGTNIDTLKTWKRVELGLRYVPSQSSLFPSLTAAEIHRLSRSTSISPDKSAAARKAGELSGGQKQFLALSAIEPQGQVYLFDEPFSGLDAPTIRRAIIDHLKPLAVCSLIAMPLVT